MVEKGLDFCRLSVLNYRFTGPIFFTLGSIREGIFVAPVANGLDANLLSVLGNGLDTNFLSVLGNGLDANLRLVLGNGLDGIFLFAVGNGLVGVLTIKSLFCPLGERNIGTYWRIDGG